jgi:hypothetical protein
MPECQATRYAPGAETDSHPACFQHGLAEVDRHHASGGIARAELKERRP